MRRLLATLRLWEVRYRFRSETHRKEEVVTRYFDGTIEGQKLEIKRLEDQFVVHAVAWAERSGLTSARYAFTEEGRTELPLIAAARLRLALMERRNKEVD